MSVRDILRWPDPHLSTVCDPVAEVTLEIEALAQELLEAMYAASGRGLAAPQVGVCKRVFVMDAAWKDGERDPHVYINPEILKASEEYNVASEGCLSLPGISVDVRRPSRVTLRWTDIAGKTQDGDFSGFAAVCVQHELDHLNGTVTLDHLSPKERARVLEVYGEVPA